MSVIHVTESNFRELLAGDRPLLLDFYADWCGPCRMMAPIVEELAEERSDFAVGKVNTDHDPALAQAFGIVSIPTLVVLKNGTEVRRFVGVRAKEELVAALEG
ncbi:MAG: thioredoxin [Ruminococcaceae bacterium]|nr:thioredoxin [Oscillospiraceae bacterium]